MDVESFFFFFSTEKTNSNRKGKAVKLLKMCRAKRSVFVGSFLNY